MTIIARWKETGSQMNTGKDEDNRYADKLETLERRIK